MIKIIALYCLLFVSIFSCKGQISGGFELGLNSFIKDWTMTPSIGLFGSISKNNIFLYKVGIQYLLPHTVSDVGTDTYYVYLGQGHNKLVTDTYQEKTTTKALNVNIQIQYYLFQNEESKWDGLYFGLGAGMTWASQKFRYNPRPHFPSKDKDFHIPILKVCFGHDFEVNSRHIFADLSFNSPLDLKNANRPYYGNNGGYVTTSVGLRL